MEDGGLARTLSGTILQHDYQASRTASLTPVRTHSTLMWYRWLWKIWRILYGLGRGGGDKGIRSD